MADKTYYKRQAGIKWCQEFPNNSDMRMSLWEINNKYRYTIYFTGTKSNFTMELYNFDGRKSFRSYQGTDIEKTIKFIVKSLGAGKYHLVNGLFYNDDI